MMFFPALTSAYTPLLPHPWSRMGVGEEQYCRFHLGDSQRSRSGLKGWSWSQAKAHASTFSLTCQGNGDRCISYVQEQGTPLAPLDYIR